MRITSTKFQCTFLLSSNGWQRFILVPDREARRKSLEQNHNFVCKKYVFHALAFAGVSHKYTFTWVPIYIYKRSFGTAIEACSDGVKDLQWGGVETVGLLHYLHGVLLGARSMFTKLLFKTPFGP